jgi:hypothetical protein
VIGRRADGSPHLVDDLSSPRKFQRSVFHEPDLSKRRPIGQMIKLWQIQSEYES